jgi:hypothetical protein
MLDLTLEITPGVAVPATALLRPFGSTSTDGYSVLSGNVAYITQSSDINCVTLPNSSNIQSIQYSLSDTSMVVSMWLKAFTASLNISVTE